MQKVLTPEAQTTADMMVVFADLTGYLNQSRRDEEKRLELLAETMDLLYERMASHVAAGGGRVVKFIGDALLAVFPEDAVERGVREMVRMKDDVETWLGTRGWKSRLVVKAHFGTLMAGPFGPKGDKRFDVIGSTVNIAATLEGGELILSPQVFRKLSPEARNDFRKHTPATVYVLGRRAP
ncbi:MAG: adenylate/guanylate cyclase domain-containing protein [Acidobacteriota bacterium]